jgi:2-hydroxy-3-keto-5-methylthiopentenyl-1-phosphate phosphatase
MSGAVVGVDTQRTLNCLEVATLQVLCDFDATITTPNSLNSWSVIERHAFASSKIYFERTAAIRKHFRRIELAPLSKISLDQKRSAMTEWWKIALGLLIDERPTRETLRAAVDELAVGQDFALRAGVDEFLHTLNEMHVPVTILSAGIGDVVILLLKRFKLLLPNITVCRFEVVDTALTDCERLLNDSNFIRWVSDDDNATAIGWQSDDVIHSMNKSFGSIVDGDYVRRLRSRTSAVVIGDTLGDAMMADGASLEHQLRIGYLNVNAGDGGDASSAARLVDYKRSFNVVLVSVV